VSSFYVWSVSFRVITIGIFCWNGFLVALVLPYRHPTPHFAAGWAVFAPIGVGTLCFFYCAIIQFLLLALLISFSLYAFPYNITVIQCN